MLVAEVHQLLTGHENTCHRTCFSLRLGGVPLDSHTKMSSIQGVRDGAVIKVEEGNCSIFFIPPFRGYYSQHPPIERVSFSSQSCTLCVMLIFISDMYATF